MPKTIKNLLVHSHTERELRRCARQYASGRMIDIGCGTKPYAGMFAPFVTEHVGLDHVSTQHEKSRVDLWGSAYEIPSDDAHFDCALCTSVLTNLEEPEAALRECLRVLKPGGTAIFTTGFLWHVNEAPRDFFRFTRYGLSHLFQKAGFEVGEIKALCGFWATFGQLLTYNLYRLNRGPVRMLHLLDPIGLVLQGLAYGMDALDRTEAWTSSYSVVARKPSSQKL